MNQMLFRLAYRRISILLLTELPGNFTSTEHMFHVNYGLLRNLSTIWNFETFKRITLHSCRVFF